MIRAMTKSCGKCKQELPIDAFNLNASSKDGLHKDCRACKKQYQAEWYQRHKDEHKLRTAKARTKFNAWYVQLKEQPCADCQQTFPYYCMDWDHIPGEPKVNDISRMAVDQRSKSIILAEIAKCELVCANCHRIRTHNRNNLPLAPDGRAADF